MIAAALVVALGAAQADAGDTIAASAARALERRPGLSDRSCTGLATLVLLGAGYELRGTVRDFHKVTAAEGWNHYRRTPKPGDLAYFDDTWDVNSDGRTNDPLSHVAVVIAVEPDGTVEMVHYGGGGITPLRMNLRHPEVYTDESGRVLNDYLAAPGYGPDNRRLTGQLWAGFATVDGPEGVASAEGVEVHESSGEVGWRVVALPSRRGQQRWVREEEDGARWLYQGWRRRAPARSAEGQILRGQRLPEGMLWGSSCDELWYLLNAVYARHGYSFVTPEARAVFEAEPWYTADPDVHQGTVSNKLSLRDQGNIGRLLDAEREAGCRS